MNDTRRTRVLLALLLVTSISLITIDYRGGEHSPLDGVRSVAATAFGPVERVAAAIASPVSDAVDGVSGLGDGGADADRLAEQNKTLRGRLRTSALDRSRAQELDDLLKVAGAGRYRVVPARVIAIGAAQTFSWTVTLDAGSRDGIRPDMTVLDGDGLVGRVKTVGPTTSTVLLAVDPESSVGVRLEGSMEVGFTTGQGIRDRGDLDLRLLDGQSSVAPGDRLVTFGSQGDTPYVPGVPVGRVVTVSGSPGSQTRTAVVSPYVDFTSLDLVGVVVEPPRKDPRDAVLPPKPAATPTPTPTVTVTVTATPRPDGSR
jgi:rod shape-determining protein MreC